MSSKRVGFVAQKGLWNPARERTMLQDRGALLEEEGDVVREYKAMHADNFLSTWLREDVERKEERRSNVNKETREEVSRTGKREGKKGEDETVGVKEGVSTLFPVMMFRNSVIGEDSDSCGNSWGDLLGDHCGLSDCVSEVSLGVLVVTDDSGQEIVEPQSFSLS